MKNKQKNKKVWEYLLFGAFFFKLLDFLFKGRRNEQVDFDPHFHWSKLGEKVDKIKTDERHVFRDFLGEEEREIEKYIFGKESFKEFFGHSLFFLKDMFVPHPANDHKPKILRPKSLLSITLVIFTVKAFFAIYLFLAYPDSAFMSENLVARVIELMNKERSVAGVELLTRSDELSRAALAKAEDMLANNYFDHYGPDGKKPWEWIHRTSYDYIYAGENLAMNFTTAESVHAALMNSESHKKNILSDKYLDVGVAMVSGEINGKQTNLLVQTFGHKRKIEELPVNIAKSEPEVKVIPVIVEKPVEVVAEEIVAAVEKIDPVSEEIIEQVEFKAEVASADTELMADTPDNELSEVDDEQASSSEISGLAARQQSEALKKVSMVVRDVVISEETEVMAEKNYLELDNNVLVTVKAAPEIIGAEVLNTQKKLRFVNYLFMAVVAIIGLLLAINIFVRVKVQHKSVIIQSVFTIVFIVALIYLKFHYLESGLMDILLM